MQRWINAQKRRYDQVQLVEGLFGHWSRGGEGWVPTAAECG
jgi:hypothetical protein